MSKSNKTLPKIYCERYRRHLRAFNSFDKNVYKTVKRVIVSKKTCSSRGDKSFSTGVINSSRGSQVNTPKKTAKSDFIFGQNMTCNGIVDYCKKCGDVPSGVQENTKSLSNRTKRELQNGSKSNSVVKIINHTKIIKNINNNNCERKPIQQYYRNEHFYQSTDSFYTTDNMKKVSLNTIMEHPAKVTNSKSRKTKDSIYELYPDHTEDEIGFMDPDDRDNLDKLKIFRENNYFECHSAKSRIHSKGGVTSLNNHKCVYRFYLNDRLFPVPVNTDYQENVRCIECSLPLANDSGNSNLNGTLQAKVKLNGEIQDMLLMLPVKNSLIVKERRKVLQGKNDLNSLYFGIIKLDLNGDSIFNRNLPSDSLALRYQKGYKEMTVNQKYEYDCIDKDDIIII